MSSENDQTPAPRPARPRRHKPHGRSRYNHGCQCPDCVAAGTTARCECPTCTAANRAYSRRNKRLKVVTNGAPAEPHEPGGGYRIERNPAELVETAVRADLDPAKMPAVREMTGLRAAALGMARVLDDPTSIPQHPAAAGQLLRVYGFIRAAKVSGVRGSVSELRAAREQRNAGGAGA